MFILLLFMIYCVTSRNKNYVIFMILAFFKNAKIIIMFTNFITINHVMNYERLKKKKKFMKFIYLPLTNQCTAGCGKKCVKNCGQIFFFSDTRFPLCWQCWLVWWVGGLGTWVRDSWVILLWSYSVSICHLAYMTTLN